MYTAAYANRNGVFLVERNPKSKRWLLRKYTFGTENYVEVRITAAIAENLESCSSFRESWSMANDILSGVLDRKRKAKLIKHKGNC